MTKSRVSFNINYISDREVKVKSSVYELYQLSSWRVMSVEVEILLGPQTLSIHWTIEGPDPALATSKSKLKIYKF